MAGEKPVCANCRFHGVVDLKTMNCQFNPPAVVPLFMQDRLGQPQVQIRGFFPPVDPQWHCSKWETDEQVQ